MPWSTLRHWLHDLASELWDATRDGTLPVDSSLDQVWITPEGRAVLLDTPWPGSMDSERVAVRDLAGQQRFLDTVIRCVDATGLPLHARSALRNVGSGSFEKLSFLTGTLRGLLDKPSEVGRGIRAASIFLLPSYIWIAVVVGRYHDKSWSQFLDEFAALAVMVTAGIAVLQLLPLPFGTTASHSTFRLAVVDSKGEPARAPRLLLRWAIVWMPLLAVLAPAGLWVPSSKGVAAAIASALLATWFAAAIYAVVRPHRGLHDHVAGTWVVRR